MIRRDIAGFIEYCASKFRVISITGPRQSGKTTLAKMLFGKENYISLEDPDNRERALSDPRGFLSSLPSKNVILDEVQNCPNLFSYIQTIVDSREHNCQFILTGSQNFGMLEKITQSLAGRVVMVELLPLSYNEIGQYKDFSNVDELIYKGGYPQVHAQNVDPVLWCKSYVMTYLERDVRSMLNIVNLSKFQLFMRLCAGRVGQLVNFSSIARECGVSYNTIKSWLAVLEARYIIYLHNPYFKSFNKRLVKQKKLYFYDTSIACALLGIKSHEQILGHYARGALFENFVIMEIIKNKFNQGLANNTYFWRDVSGHEVDIIIDDGDNVMPIEVKASQTFSSDLTKGLKRWCALSGDNNTSLVYQGDKSFVFQDTNVVDWKNIRSLCD